MLGPARQAAVVLLLLGSVTAALRLLHADDTVAGLAYLVSVLLITVRVGPRPGALAALLATVAFSYYFLGSPDSFLMAQDNWIALSAFLIGSAIAGDLVIRVKRQAEESER